MKTLYILDTFVVIFIIFMAVNIASAQGKVDVNKAVPKTGPIKSKEWEDVMSNEADLIKNIIDSSNAKIYLKDEKGRYIFVNRQGAERFNLKKEDFIGKTIYDFLPKEEAEIVMVKEHKVMETGTPMNFKFKITTEKGELTIIDHKFPVSLEGHPNTVGIISIDFSELEE